MEKAVIKKVRVSDAIEAFGGASNLARFLTVSRSAVYQFGKSEFLPDARAWQVCDVYPELDLS